ncbi:rhomboid family intramembrane serine protease [Hymenobacter fodinae]|uniref:Rhomboid family intramembrane serine protease n=1 Tax=Hymenobacter fodinae TaxID=2510796 RepID=A0A4Z0PD01_9BACT|nr:rhomboid family intramembrane serine protease [Hymenobacter fodinae]TGE10525.1 rhomboid family intramembrane serine protease [Hymenobacter fodinae]
MAGPDLTSLFAQKTDAELLYLAQHGQRYPATVVQAAVQELQRRGLIPEELPQGSRPRPQPAAPEPEPTGWAFLRQVSRGVFWPRPGYVVTPLLLWLNVLAYVLVALAGNHALAPTGAELVRWGANFSPLTLPGQPWRLLTSCFLHGGPAHLLMNMSSLVFLGLMTEGLTGRLRLLVVYLLSGVGGSLLSLWWHTQGVLSVGASGAIFGLYGLLLATLAGHPTSFDRSARRTVLLFVFYLMASSLAGGLEAHTTDNAAHVGGLLTGLVLGWLWPRRRVE